MRSPPIGDNAEAILCNFFKVEIKGISNPIYRYAIMLGEIRYKNGKLSGRRVLTN